MKLLLERDSLAAALGRVAKCAGKGDKIPIIGQILLEASDRQLRLTATDLDLRASATLAATIDAPGAITVAARTFSDIVSRTPSGSQMVLEEAPNANVGTALAIKAGRSRIALQTLPAVDFPEANADGTETEFLVDAKLFSKLLDKVDFAISKEETRYYLRGAFLHAHESELRAVTTDGHRLAVYALPLPLGAQGLSGVIIPEGTVAELIRLGKDAPGDVKIRLSPSKIVAEYESGVTIISKLIEGAFPDYMRVIPESNPKRAIVDHDAMSESVARLAALAGEARIVLTFADGILRLSVNNPVAGEAVDEIEIDYEGEPLEVGFSPTYLRDTLGALSSEKFLAELDTPGSAAKFTPRTATAKSDDALTLILMPRAR